MPAYDYHSPHGPARYPTLNFNGKCGRFFTKSTRLAHVRSKLLPPSSQTPRQRSCALPHRTALRTIPRSLMPAMCQSVPGLLAPHPPIRSPDPRAPCPLWPSLEVDPIPPPSATAGGRGIMRVGGVPCVRPSSMLSSSAFLCCPFRVRSASSRARPPTCPPPPGARAGQMPPRTRARQARQARREQPARAEGRAKRAPRAEARRAPAVARRATTKSSISATSAGPCTAPATPTAPGRRRCAWIKGPARPVTRAPKPAAIAPAKR